MFNHVGVELQPITATNKDGVRLYETPEGNKYPSITTVLSVRNKKGLMEWRKRVGNDVANHVAKTAANRGTKVHHMCEDYLNNMPTNFPKNGRNTRRISCHIVFLVNWQTKHYAILITYMHKKQGYIVINIR